MYAIRVTGPSGYSRYWNTDGVGFLSDRPFDTHDTCAEAEAVADAIMKREECFGRIVDIVDLEGE